MSRAIPINPKLPARFDDTPNDERPPSHERWWERPYIVAEEFFGKPDDVEWREKWMKAWPSGIRYNTRCLDGGAWDRSTSWGMFATLEEAIACAQSGPVWRKGAQHP